MPLLTPQYDFHRIEEIPTDFFIRHGIRALLLDVYNTLTGDNSQEIKPEVMDWLERQRAAGLRLFVISNNHELRGAPFANRLGLGYIADAAKPKKKVAGGHLPRYLLAWEGPESAATAARKHAVLSAIDCRP